MQVESALLFESPEELCARVFREIRPRTPVPQISVSFKRFANANSFIRMAEGTLELRITDLLADAPAPILEALAYILISKLFRREVPKAYSQRYKMYLNRHEIRRDIHKIRQSRGRKYLSDPQGRHYDLTEVFDAVNRRFFEAQMERPDLGWSLRVSRTILGHFDPSHNAIVLSRILDGPKVPRLAIEYVMYHEMLHLRHPVEIRGATRSIHPPSFQAEEKKFPQLKEAKLMIRQLCSTSSRSWHW